MDEISKAVSVIETLISKQCKNGSFSNAETSITRSSGKSLVVETTSICLIAMVRLDFSKYRQAIDKSVEFLMSQMNNGYFYSTQGTILALRSLIEVLSKVNEQKSPIEFVCSINGTISKTINSDQSKSF
jgi:hypothetical protein